MKLEMQKVQKNLNSNVVIDNSSIINLIDSIWFNTSNYITISIQIGIHKMRKITHHYGPNTFINIAQILYVLSFSNSF